ncbi:MAG: PglZ domain-containing protein [Pseudonocardiaceae bacterium]
MHPLHDYVAKWLADEIRRHSVVVWYDERAEFAPFIDEIRGGPRTGDEAVRVTVNDTSVWLAEYAGSMFELRAAAEPYIGGDSPDPVVVYLPGRARDLDSSVLAELEQAGTVLTQRLVDDTARHLLLRKYTLGVVDAMLSPGRRLAYEDIARLARSDGPEPPSVLRSVFHDVKGAEAVLAAWLADDSRDADISSKAATPELVALIHKALGLQPPREASLSKLRAITIRYVLANEFRMDLSCDPPAALDGVPTPSAPDAESAVRELAKVLRADHPKVYPTLADQVEAELGLRDVTLPAGFLGSIDTFRFEERELLRHCGELIAEGRYDEALSVVTQRQRSFWLDLDVGRRTQWEVVRRMAELGGLAVRVRAEVAKANGDAQTWLSRYTSAPYEWYRMDQAQRRLEALVATLHDDPDERPLGLVRRVYEDTCHQMAAGFTRALVSSGWTVPGALHQTQIYRDVVSAQPKPVAYFFVDAMRYEMGIGLMQLLPASSEVSVRPAIAALPSITPIGMAALQPGASSSFSVREQGGKLGAQIEDAFLPDLAARKKFAEARIPKLADLELIELLSLQPARLAKRINGAQVVVVRSQEIDQVGEAGFTYHARQVMDTVIENLARAVRKLAAAGVAHAVVTADHGHLFFAADRDESMRTDSPGGNTVDLHRRCWIGRGGATPPGCVRVAASALGYASDLELVFPTGTGVFRAGGDLAYHHGGPSLQELVVPVVTIRTSAHQAKPVTAPVISVSDVPQTITVRIVPATVTLGDDQLVLGATGMAVRAVLVSNGRQVGAVGMVRDAEFDAETEQIRLEPGQPAAVAFVLNDDTIASLRIVILDPATDAELYRSPKEIPIRLGVQ